MHLLSVLPRRSAFRILFSTLAVAAGAFPVTDCEAHPRMISYDFPNCVSCHVSVQGRGLLNKYGRGIDIEQSLYDADFSARGVSYFLGEKYAEGNWEGRFGNVLADFTTTTRINQEFDTDKTDPTFSAVIRQIIFLGKKQKFRVNYEVGLRDTGLRNTALGPNLTATGGGTVFLKKATFEWRIDGGGAKGGSELVLGRDYLPLGIQIDDYTTYILHLNRDGIFDYPLQLKYFKWTEKYLASAYVYAPTFDEADSRREWGGGFMYEYYPTNRLALGVQALTGFSEQSDRTHIGGYARWGISRKWSLLAEVDYTRFWDAGDANLEGDQTTAFMALYYNHTEWLVSSLSGNFAYTPLLPSGDQHFGWRYTLSARVNRNLTLGVTFAEGDIRRNLSSGEEGAFFANVKF